MNCKLIYIPPHLHFKDKPIVERFDVGEELYYRCSGDSCKKPYDRISLYSISHNRNFSDNDTYPKEDVLINIVESEESEKYDSEIVILKIEDLGDQETYIKRLISRDDKNISAEIKLIHDPLPCMYPHSVFEIFLGGVAVTDENYKKTLGRSNRTMKNLRSDIRQELTSIVQTGKLDTTQDILYITDL